MNTTKLKKFVDMVKEYRALQVKYHNEKSTIRKSEIKRDGSVIGFKIDLMIPEINAILNAEQLQMFEERKDAV